MNERLTWIDLPAKLRHWVESTLGSSIISHESQNSGFSLGTADRLTTTDDQRAFLKAVSAAEHPHTASLHRAELNVATLFAGAPHTASLIDSYTEDGWVALLMEDIEGNHPQMPWREEDLILTLKGLDALSHLSFDGIETLDDLTDSISHEFRSWETIAKIPLTAELYAHLSTDPNLGELQAYFEHLNSHADEYAQRVEEDVIASLSGQHLVHSDLRADNILLTQTGEAVFIDWPYACRGAAYVDSASILADVVAQGGNFSWDAATAASSVLRDTPRRTIESSILAFAGYYLWSAQLPPRGDTNSTLPAFRLQRALNLVRWILEDSEPLWAAR